jgi:hypothetical protein
MARVVVYILFSIPCAVPVGLTAQTSHVPVDSLSWVAACREGKVHSGKTQEQWLKPEGRSMLGMSRTIVNGKTVSFEFLQIREERENLYYVARPRTKGPTSFKLVQWGTHRVVFENPEHDLPQRIIYSLQSDGSLLARIEGEEKEKERSVNFPMKRVKCD